MLNSVLQTTTKCKNRGIVTDRNGSQNILDFKFALFCGTGDYTQGFVHAKQTLYYWWETVRLITLNVETHSLDNSTYPFHLTFKGIGDDSVHKVFAAES